MPTKPSNAKPMRRVGPEDENRASPDDATTLPTLAERTVDQGAATEPQRKADKMRQEMNLPTDDPQRGLRRPPGREDAGR